MSDELHREERLASLIALYEAGALTQEDLQAEVVLLGGDAQMDVERLSQDRVNTSNELPKESPQEGPAKRRFGIVQMMALAVVAGLGLCLVAVLTSSEETCKTVVRDRYGGDNRFVEQTFVKGDFYKGKIGQYNGGVESTYGQWECTVTDGKPTITWFHLAD